MENTDKYKGAPNNKIKLIGARRNFYAANSKDQSTYSNNAMNIKNIERYKRAPNNKNNLIGGRGNVYIVYSNNRSSYSNKAVNIDQTEIYKKAPNNKYISSIGGRKNSYFVEFK